MNIFGTASLLGLILGLALIYWLRPLNAGAMTLVLILSISAANALAAALKKRQKQEKS